VLTSYNGILLNNKKNEQLDFKIFMLDERRQIQKKCITMIPFSCMGSECRQNCSVVTNQIKVEENNLASGN
jgi:hypothetical protein